jgi:hypothetical protein
MEPRHYEVTPPGAYDISGPDALSEPGLALQIFEAHNALDDTNAGDLLAGEEWASDKLVPIVWLQDQISVFVPRVLSYSKLRELNHYAAVYRSALPFTDSDWSVLLLEHRERYSRLDELEVANGAPSEAYALVAREVRANIGRHVLLQHGVRHEVDVDELHDRWTAWRLQQGEYEGTGSLEIACAALARMSGVLGFHNEAAL